MNETTEVKAAYSINELWTAFYEDDFPEGIKIGPEEVDGWTYITFSEDGYKEQIEDYCKKLKANIQTEGQQGDVLGFLEPLKRIMESFPRPYTMIQEPYHIDRVFRDSYYRYFSSQHFHIKRYSRRLSFFSGVFKAEDYYSSDFQQPLHFEEHHYTEVEDEEVWSSEHTYYGSIVINPLITGVIGRTLINPKYILEPGERPVFVRLSNFKVHIYGRKWRVMAFPYRMQDGETMRCAEVTVLNLIEYYANTYPEYRNALPSDVLEEEKRHSHERVLPSKGTYYAILSKMLTGFGFFPRLYDIFSIETSNGSKIKREDYLRRWLYYYVESGIPIAVNLSPSNKHMTSHSLVCIGRGSFCPERRKFARSIKQKPLALKEEGLSVINAADYFDDFVVVDDNEPVYHVRKYDNLSLYPELKVSMLVAPLYKRMYVDAPDAEKFIYSLLFDEKLGIEAWTSGDTPDSPSYLNKRENVVMRLFMTSSYSFKRFRSRTLYDLDTKELYATLPMPRFVWVCELYREKEYCERLGKNVFAFAEIVIDATSSPTKQNPVKGLVLMHYPRGIAHRYPNSTSIGFEEMFTPDDYRPFKGFEGNLVVVK